MHCNEGSIPAVSIVNHNAFKAQDNREMETTDDQWLRKFHLELSLLKS